MRWLVLCAVCGVAVWGMPLFADGEKAKEEKPLVQVALLLDTSGSMEGLINQARRQLWRFVNELATAKMDGKNPRIEVALYEYGNDKLPRETQWIRCVVGLTADLDLVAKELFALRTSGGTECCGAVIKHAVENLKWSNSPKALKVIFIAGNEPFTQGSVDYRVACKMAVERGIIVNTIYCGPYDAGARSGWKDGARLAEGKYMNIDQRKVVHIEAPQDKRLAELGQKLGKLVVPFGRYGAKRLKAQEAVEKEVRKAGAFVAAERALAKARAADSSAWDLVDAVRKGKVKLEDIKTEDLPEKLRKMTLQQRKDYIQKLIKERERIEKEIERLSRERREYIQKKMKELEKEGAATLGAAMIKALREQAKKKGFVFEDEKK